MVVKDYGYDLISLDLKRLKRLKSLEKDLDVYFLAHKNSFYEHNLLSCKIADGRTTDGSIYWVCKERIVVTKPKTGASDGCRLWFVLLFKNPATVYYIRVLLYSAKEEVKYPKSLCYKKIKEILSSVVGGSGG